MTVYHVRTPAGVAKYHEPIGAVIYAKSHLLREVKDVVAHPNDGATIEHPKPSGKPGSVKYVYTASDGKWHYAHDVGKDGKPDPYSAGKTPEKMPALLDKFSEKHPEVRYTVKQGVQLPGGKIKEAPPDNGPDLKAAAEALKPKPEQPEKGKPTTAAMLDAAPVGTQYEAASTSNHYIKQEDGSWQGAWPNASKIPSDQFEHYLDAQQGGTFSQPVKAPEKKTYSKVMKELGDAPAGSMLGTTDGSGTYIKQADGTWHASWGQISPELLADNIVGGSIKDGPKAPAGPAVPTDDYVGSQKTKQEMLDKPEQGDTMHTDTGYEWKFDGKVWQSSANTSMSAANFKNGAEHNDMMNVGPLDPSAPTKPVTLDAIHASTSEPAPTHKLAPEEIPYDVGEETHMKDLTSPGDDKFPLAGTDYDHDFGSQVAATPTAKDKYAVEDYTGSGASNINPGLRDGDSPDSYEDCSYIDDAMRGLKKNTTLYRSIPVEAFHYESFSALLKDKKKLIGTTFNDKGYSSTTYYPQNVDESPLVMKIHAPKGIPAVDAEAVSEYHSEREILLGRGMNYKITNVRKVMGPYGGPKTVIDVDAIGSPEYPNLKQPRESKVTHTLSTEKKKGEGVHQALTPKGVPKIEKLKGAAPGTKLTDLLHTWTKTDHGSWVGPSGKEMDSAGLAQAAGQVAHDQGTVFHLEEPEAAHASEGKYGPGKHPLVPKTVTAALKTAGVAPSFVNKGLGKALIGTHPARTPEIVLTWAPLFKKAPVNSVTFDSNSPGIFYVKDVDGNWNTMANGGKAIAMKVPSLTSEMLSKYAGGSGWRLFVK